MVDIEKMGFLEKLIIKMQTPKLENKVIYYRLMAITQKAGLGIRESIVSILRSEKHGGLKRILADILEQVNQGLSLATAMENHKYFFQKDEIELVKSSETMGNLPEVLQNLATELENQQKIIGKIKSAMMYPSVVLSFSGIAIVILLVKVLPTIVELFPSKDKLPGITLFMLNSSDYLQAYWFYMITGIFGAITGYKSLYAYFLPFKIIMDKIFLKLIIIGPINKRFNLYRFSKLLGDFYSAGVSPTVALTQIGEIMQNYHYKTKVINVKNDLEIGLSFTESLEGSWLFDPILIQIIGIGENTGNIGEVLDKMAEFYREELDTHLEGLMKMIEPLLMAFVAGIIGVIVASVFLPMADLIGTIGGEK